MQQESKNMKSVFKNNAIIHRNPGDKLIGFDNDKEGNLVVTFINLDGYTIIPTEQYEKLQLSNKPQLDKG